MGGLYSTIRGPKPFRGQKYLKIRKHYLQLGRNFSFKDLKFAAGDTILTIGHDIPRNIEWKRPNELCDNPNLLVGLLGENSVCPGLLSQPWIVSAFALLAARTELWHWVVPQYRSQCWGEEPSAHPGIFHFRLWYRGEWVDVVIDDNLPTLDGRLVGAQSTCSFEWWPALLEKAYAKLLGSYAALKSVELSDVLIDLTGGVSETWTLSQEIIYAPNGAGDTADNFSPLFQKLKMELMHQSLVTAFVKSQNPDEAGTSSDRSALGLELGQPYLLLSAKKVFLESSVLKGILKGKDKVSLVRICNPCQVTQKTENLDVPQKSENEGNGETDFVFTHKHLSRMLSKVPEWSRLTEAEKQKMGLNVDDDREFWMPFEDFLSQFSELCVCRLLSSAGALPLACGSAIDGRNWHENSLRGVWPASALIPHSSGRSTPTQNLLKNPQFLMDVPGVKGADVVIQLLQWSPADIREDQNYHAIGLSILKVEENRMYRLHSVLGHCPSVMDIREVRRRAANGHCHLTRGRYLVIPHTEWQAAATPQQLGKPPPHFLLRTFSSTSSNLRSVSLNLPPPHWWSCFSSNIDCITVVTVKAAEGLRHRSTFFGCNPYCEICCEGVKVCTPIVHNSTDPNWERSFVFYRKVPNQPLLARVLSYHSLLRNKLIGQAQLPAPVNHQPSLLRVDLTSPGFEEGASQGVLVLEVTTEDDLQAI